MNIGDTLRTELVLNTLDLALENLYDRKSFSYEDYEQATARAAVLLSNLQIVLILEHETNQNNLRDACVRWVHTMESAIPIGWERDRLTFIQASPGWKMVLKAIAGEVPFKSLIGLHEQNHDQHQKPEDNFVTYAAIKDPGVDYYDNHSGHSV